MYSAYKLNKQGDNIQTWRTPFPIWNQSVVPCPVLTVSSWPAYRFLRMQVRWFSISISLRIFQFIVIKTVKGFSIVNEAEVDVFLEISCFFCVPMDVGNLISGSSSLKSGGQKWGYQSIDNTYLRGSWRSLDEVTRVSTLWYINSFFLSNSTHGGAQDIFVPLAFALFMIFCQFLSANIMVCHKGAILNGNWNLYEKTPKHK